MKSIARQFFDSLKGRWSFYRTLSEHGYVEGVATFKEITTFNLYYEEEGIWTMPNQTRRRIYRDYAYCYNLEKDKITV